MTKVPSAQSTRLREVAAAKRVTTLPASTPAMSTRTGILLPAELPVPNEPLLLAPHATNLVFAHCNTRSFPLPP